MSKKTDNNQIPDFSAVFDIDNESLPKELIEKDPSASTKNLGFLSGSNEDEEAEKEKRERLSEENTKTFSGSGVWVQGLFSPYQSWLPGAITTGQESL